VRIGDDPVRVVEIQVLEDPILQRWEPIITDAIEKAGGSVAMKKRIPRAVVDLLVAEA